MGLLALMLLDRVAPRRAHHRRRRPRAARRPGPRPVGSRASSPKARPSSGAACARNQPGPYQIQAAINAVHSDAPIAADDRLAPDPARSTTSCCRSRRAPVVAPQPRGGGRRGRRTGTRRSRSSIALDGSTATTCSTPSAPICCGASAATTRRRRAYDAAIARTDNARERALPRAQPPGSHAR